jgi:hypothetical protein
MNNYEEEIFNFLTTRQNFENVIRVREHWDMIQQKLLIDFWDLVIEKIDKGLEELNLEWKTFLKGSYSVSNSSIWLFKKEWEVNTEETPPIRLEWQAMMFSTLHYGITVNLNSKLWNPSKMFSFLREDINIQKHQSNGNWYPYYVDAPYSFETPKGLLRILPENRDEIANEYANTLLKLIDEYGDLMQEAYDRFRI